jgi:hypothetical protein
VATPLPSLPPRTTELYDRTADMIMLDEVERIGIWNYYPRTNAKAERLTRQARARPALCSTARLPVREMSTVVETKVQRE